VKILQANAQTALIMTRRILVSYYAATLLFLLLDHIFGIDIRLAFLEANSSVRLTYYAFCLACFAGMLLRPGPRHRRTREAALVIIGICR